MNVPRCLRGIAGDNSIQNVSHFRANMDFGFLVFADENIRQLFEEM